MADELSARGAGTAAPGHRRALRRSGPSGSAGQSRGQRHLALLGAGSLRRPMAQSSLALGAWRNPVLLCPLQIYAARRVNFWTRFLWLNTLNGLCKDWKCLKETENYDR